MKQKYLFVTDDKRVYFADKISEDNEPAKELEEMTKAGWIIISLNTTAFMPAVWDQKSKSWKEIKKI